MLEIEVKIKIDQPKKIHEKLLSLKARLHKPRYYEENILYDFTDQKLTQKNQALRLRSIAHKNRLTYKGPLQKSRKFKIRNEYETEIKDKKQIQKILASLGLKQIFLYQKFRTEYRSKKLKICLDETKAGLFLEFEGQREDIVTFAKKMGFSKKDFIKADYVSLIKEAENKTETN
ncbi:MAG: class IV adenylate cyclase [Candidatus Aminicenantes bacterium]|nr:class IV adenylate cyclase [Candidatus Aminicenantes bacterium]